MARFFNGKKVELMAPAGTFEIFKQLLPLPCDAFYYGGKLLNMRLHRKDFNFTNEELIQSVTLSHQLNKKSYITVNNLHGKEDLSQLGEYLCFLAEEVKPNAIIIQDFSIIDEVKRLKLDLEIHASVMMNVHNFETVQRLKELGITRVIMSRDLPLSYVKLLSKTTDMEFEYFIHGDMCVAHGSTCLYSGILFGKSSNRGKCMKPCRWDFNGSYPLAVKDMYMYENIPELIDNGVTAFKIEGRMRDFDYLKILVEAYGDAINRYIDDPLGFDRKKDADTLYGNRKRDFSTAYAFGVPGPDNINTRYEGTGKFYSTGKVFSVAAEEPPVTKEKTDELKKHLLNHKHINQSSNQNKLKIGVKVNDFNAALAALSQSPDNIYLSCDTFTPAKPFSKEQIRELAKNKKSSKIYLALPHMMFDIDFEEIEHLLKADLGLDGLMCTNLGAIRKFKERKFIDRKLGIFDLIGDYPLNVYNRQSAAFFLQEGLNSFTISPEVNITDLVDIMADKSEEAHLIVQGSPTVMYLEHDLFNGKNGKLLLKDAKGFNHPVYKDRSGRNHMLLYRDLCLLPILPELCGAGLTNITIEAKHLEPKEIEKVVNAYQGKTDLDIANYSFGALNHI